MNANRRNVCRKGHIRTNSYGTTFDVRPHEMALSGTEKYSVSITVPCFCPKCGLKIFFYKNSRGSRVSFDSLGYPWPKHPCFDSQERMEEAQSERYEFQDETLLFEGIYIPSVKQKSEGMKGGLKFKISPLDINIVLDNWLAGSAKDIDSLKYCIIVGRREKVEGVGNWNLDVYNSTTDSNYQVSIYEVFDSELAIRNARLRNGICYQIKQIEKSIKDFEYKITMLLNNKTLKRKEREVSIADLRNEINELKHEKIRLEERLKKLS